MDEPHRTNDYPQSTARMAGHPLHPMLIPFPLVFFTSLLVTDLIFAFADADPFWAELSRVLLIAGLVTAAVAALAGLADFAGSRAIRAIGLAWAHMIGNVIAVLLEVANLILRLGEAAPGDAILPLGLACSAVAAAILGFTGWAGGELVYRHGVAVSGDKASR